MLVRILIKAWMLPPGINILLIVAGLLLIKRARLSGLLLVGSGVVSLWLLSTAVVSSLLLLSIEDSPHIDIENIPADKPVAIVVLGAGHDDTSIEYGVSTPTDGGLVRLHYAANLHRRTQLPVLLTGGPMNEQQNIHSEILAQSLQDQFRISAKWLERKSATTWQNALYSAEILSDEGISDILLVTHSYHMRRSVHLFKLAGFNVLPAPTQLGSQYDWRNWQYWLPNSQALDLSSKVLYEYVGLLWYRLVSPVGNQMESGVRNIYAN